MKLKRYWHRLILSNGCTLTFLCFFSVGTALGVQNTVVVWGSEAVTNVPLNITNVASVATGSDCVAVLRDGRLRKWGSGGTNVPTAATNVLAVSAAGSRFVALRRDGLVIDHLGAFRASNAVAVVAPDAYGAGAIKNSGVFVAWDGLWSPANNTSNVVAVAKGGYATLRVLFTDGTLSPVPSGLSATPSNLVAMADGNYAVFLKADGTVISSSNQINILSTLSNVVAVASGYAHGLALRSDGTVVAWGDNNVSQTNVPYGLSNVVAISAGNYHSLALKADGTVVAWGSNSIGQTNVPVGLTNVAAIFAGPNYSVAIVGDSPPALHSQLADESVWAGQAATFTVKAVGTSPLRFQWQFNGEIIAGATNSFYRIASAAQANSGIYNVVVSNARGLAASREATLIVRPNPNVLIQPASRTNVFGGNATFTVTVQSPFPVGYQWYFNGMPIGGGTQSSLIVSNAASEKAGSYWCVISNSFSVVTSSVAQLSVVLPIQPITRTSWIGGTATFTATTAGSLPIAYQWYFNDVPVSGATNLSLVLTDLAVNQTGNYWMTATSAFGGVTSSVASLSINAIATWGNAYGYNVPTDLQSVAAIGVGWYHYFARRGAGTEVVWGLNDNGAGGSNAASLPAGLSNIVALAGGAGHSIALLADGTVRVWGRSDFGAANIPSGLSNLVAVAAGTYHCMTLGADGVVRTWGGFYGTLAVPAGLEQVVSIASRAYHCLALRSNGTVVSWGENNSGQTNVPANLRNVVAIAAGYAHSVALRADGTVVAWGDTVFGQTNVPSGLSNVIAIASGFYHTLALRADGSIVAWGSDSYGQSSVPSDLSNVVAIAAGGYFNLALTSEGLVAPTVHTFNAAHSNGVFSLQTQTARGRAYHLQYRDSLADPHWRLMPPVPGDGSVKTLRDPTATTAQRFYHVWQKP